MSHATHWKSSEEVYSLKQRKNFKGIRGKDTNMCKKISREFNATCQVSNKKFQVQQVASREEVEILRHELSHSLAEGSQSQNPQPKNDLVRPKVHQQFSSCDMSVIMWLFMVTIWKPKTLRYRSAVSPLFPQVAQSPRLTGMPQVERLKTNTLQAFLLRLRAGKSLKVWKGLNERFSHLQPRCHNFCCHPEPHAVCARVGKSFARAAVDDCGRKPACICCRRYLRSGYWWYHLNWSGGADLFCRSALPLACPCQTVLTVPHILVIPGQPTQSSNVHVEEPKPAKRDTTSQGRRYWKTWARKPGLISESSGSGE